MGSVVLMECLSSESVSVCVDDYVEVQGETGHSKGSVCEILLSGPPSRVRLKNGDAGYVIRIIESTETVLRRIMDEDQYTENKENFNEPVMRDKVIPQTVQSFLNSEGGYLYIGVRDTGRLNERLVGIDRDLDAINSSDRSNDKLCDIFKKSIMESLEKYLRSDASISSLIRIKILNVQDVQIVEVRILKSSMPWFYTHLSKNKKLKLFKCYDGKSMHERRLDDFYIRQGNVKKMLQTHEDFYRYARTRFHEGV